MKWYEKWFDENYLKLYNHRDLADAQRQADLIVRTLKPSKDAAILDLACGEGRHCMIFHQRGYRISGMDLSETLIRIGKQRHPQLDLFTGDMREIPGRYDIILSLFTSFGYFDTDDENEQVIESVSAALNSGGWYWLDFLNPEHVRSKLVPESESELADGSRAIERRRIDGATVIKEIQLVADGRTTGYEERVRMYTRDELETFFRRHGIIPEGAFGDYAGAPHSAASERTIVYGRKQ